MSKPYEIPSDVKRINKIFRAMHTSREKYVKHKLSDEEFYYADVEETRSQFTKSQLSFIKQKYDVPISTKITFAIIEQILAFLTGGKPAIQLSAQEELQREWVMLSKRLVDSIWYENNMDHEIYRWLKDAIVTGSGFLHIRPNNFYRESTFGVVAEHVTWRNVYIDPYCTRPDLSDADYVCIAYTMPRGKAEREFDIKIDSDTTLSNVNNFSTEADPFQYADYGFDELADFTNQNHEFKPVWIKRFYEKKKVKTYITPNGYVSLEEPEAVPIPNPDKAAIQEQIAMLEEQYNLMQQEIATGDEESINYSPAPNQQNEQLSSSMEQIEGQISFLNNEMAAMPDTVTGYLLKLENEEVVIDTEYSVIDQKRIQSTLLVGDHKKEEFVCATDELPVHHLWFAHSHNINNTYGVIHFIKDLGQGMNKLWGSLIYDMQMRTSLRVIHPNQSISDPVTAEQKFALPGAWIGYDADPELPNGGRPEITDVPPANQYLMEAIRMLQQMAEYVTGIFGVVQGNPESAPTTMGATYSLQSYGTQRIKQMSRQIEASLAPMGYNLIKYLQRYCPKEKILQLVNPEANIEIFNQEVDTKFRVRVSVSQSLPTSRQIAASALSALAGQSQSPGLQELLMQYMLKFMDIQEADEISQAMDVISKYEQQLAQQGQQLEEMQSQMKAAQNNIMQKDLALQREKGMSDINVAVEKQKLALENEGETDAEGIAIPDIF